MNEMNQTRHAVVAIPTAAGLLCPHFGHCESFAVVTVKDGAPLGGTSLPPPPHQPGLLPRWLAEQGVTHVIAGGMGARAQQIFSQVGVRVVVGAPVLPPEQVVRDWLAGALELSDNTCDH